MTTASRRLRSSTAPSLYLATSALSKELKPLLQAVQDVLSRDHLTASALNDTSPSLQRVRQWLVDSPQPQAKDVFRHLCGFQLLLDTFRLISGLHGPTQDGAGTTTFLEFFKAIFAVLGEALDGHDGNRRFFHERIEGGGWTTIEQVIASTGVASASIELGSSHTFGPDELYGCLFAFALCNDDMIGLFGEIRGRLASMRWQDAIPEDGVESSSASSFLTAAIDGPKADEISSAHAFRLVQAKVLHALGPHPRLRIPDIIPTICNFWLASRRRPKPENSLVDHLSASILVTLHEIISASKRNLFLAHSTAALSLVLPCLFDGSLSKVDTFLLRRFADRLSLLGVSSFKDAVSLYRNAMVSSEVTDFLLSALRLSKQPAHVQFDLSLHGFSSIEIPTLGRVFPPSSSSAGYSFIAWIYIDTFDPNMHTTLFGAFDSTQTCFVLAYIEKSSHNLILQTSIKSSKPSVRFKSRSFEPKRWYHVGLVHSRPRTTSSSKATLFVDGECVEQLKCQYPSVPPALSSSSPRKYGSVQAFLGTPQDLSGRLGRDMTFSQWSLASFHLFEDTLSHDLVAVYYRLGPRYHGNFQDCLGSFQTYEASAALSLRNEAVHAGKEEKSPLVSAIRLKGGNILPESRILLNITPLVIWGIHGRTNVGDSPIVNSLSKGSAGNLLHLTRLGGSTVAINGAIPSMNEALTQPHGVALLVGDPVVLQPESLDDDIWRVGGCAAIGLNMVAAASTREGVVRAVEVLLESVKDNWRNSEAMEKENAFGILGMILRDKMGIARSFAAKESAISDPIVGGSVEWQKLSFELLSLILGFVGFRHQERIDSVIVNPLAYRILLVDLDIWRKSTYVTHKLYYEQFVVFAVESRYHTFNSKRLVRMRVIKKLLDALKGESFTPEILPHFARAVGSLLRLNMSTEVFRTLSLFVTYCLHKNEALLARPITPSGTTRSAGTQSPHLGPPSNGIVTTSTTLPKPAGPHELSRLELAIVVLTLYTDLLCAGSDTSNIKKFARTVTNKWLLYLLAEDDPEVVSLGLKILTRLLVSHGSSYVNKFASTTGGFIIMERQLKRWWKLPAVWVLLLTLLFGADVNSFKERAVCFDDLQIFLIDCGKAKLVYPDVFPVIIAMLGTSLRTVSQAQNGQEGKLPSDELPATAAWDEPGDISLSSRSTSGVENQNGDGSEESITAVKAVLAFLADLHKKSQAFRDFAVSSGYIQGLLSTIYPLIVPAKSVGADVELHARDAIVDLPTLSADHHELRPASLQTVKVQTSPHSNPRPRPTQRASSFILITSHHAQRTNSLARLNAPLSSNEKDSRFVGVTSALLANVLEIITMVFSDQIFQRKDFAGFGIFLKAPPGLPEQLVSFESYILRRIILRLREKVLLEPKVLKEPAALNNVARTVSHLGEAILEGWFVDGTDTLLDYAGIVLECLQKPELTGAKSLKLCNHAIVTIRHVFLVAILLQLSASSTKESAGDETVSLLNKILYWQPITFGADTAKSESIRLFWYLLYTKLTDRRQKVRLAAANFWRILLVQVPVDATGIMDHALTLEEKQLLLEFQELKVVDDETFLSWVDDRRGDLDALFHGAIAKEWEDFVSEENQKTLDTSTTRTRKRKEKLTQWAVDEALVENTLHRHEVAHQHWMVNIYASERLKHQRAMQDQQEAFNFSASEFKNLVNDLKRPCGLLDDSSIQTWRLDQTEGRNRMRLRLLPAPTPHDPKSQSKVKQQHNEVNGRLEINVRPRCSSSSSVNGNAASSPASTIEFTRVDGVPGNSKSPGSTKGLFGAEDDFELIDNPRDDGEGFEDNNRIVVHSLQRGDQVEHVYNISRIIGLEAYEGLLILGKGSLYLLDGFFQRSDGEIVSVSQAPKDERDPYLQMISGRHFMQQVLQRNSVHRYSRNWVWTDVLSISKRRFLFRDVAIELFFTDGRSYLLTNKSPTVRDGLYSRLIEKAPHIRGNSMLNRPEDIWRLETLISTDEIPLSLGSKIVSVFNSAHPHPATQQWIKGEMSNFHYLMLVNTMAGRTFNDLTQYPVFPWVLADYTSDELDLTNPKTFRDLSKPMGAQTAERRAEFRERFNAFADLGDLNAPPFHYGTHYSSAMIVTSYLIRLEPFVQSYLLLQGGNFDHADRMFFSIKNAWTSASREHMTDVRELIPEFFYLPEFLENLNGYKFGLRQGTEESIDSVTLPPWAKGDPKIFVAKHREALESPYVSRHLHHWIDLVFGFKQRGEAAVEATNVFHHLSYHGAKDLDSIEDPIERLATIGIIHNFGQTPHQVFQKGHPQREVMHNKLRKLDSLVESLTRLPLPLLESGERVSSLLYSDKQQRLLCSAALRLNIPPDCEKYMEWGFMDDSVRFYQTDNRKLVGLFEHMHQTQLSSAIFADSKTLVTAGTDCTVAVWALTLNPKSVDLQAKVTFFGHKHPVTVLAASRSYGVLLSVSTDGQALLWDSNRLQFVRKLASGGLVECARINDVTGDIVLCRTQTVSLYTLNGQLFLEQSICDSIDDHISSCAFYEGGGVEWLHRDLLFTGHTCGVVNVWSKVIRDGKFELDLIKRLDHVDPGLDKTSAASITCILPMSHTVYTGDEDGKVYEWNVVRQQRHSLPFRR